MQAIQVDEYGNEEQLRLVEISRPTAGLGQVLVRIYATSLNPIDPKRVSGMMRQIFPLQFPFTPGGDFSGVVDSAGREVTAFKPGDEVIGYSMAGGAYAGFIAIDADKVAFKPQKVGHIEAASLTLVAQTALQMLDRAGVHQGQTVLIHGAGGAVGGVAVQIAHERGAVVFATASAASLDRVRAYGADRVIDYASARFDETFSNVDVVLDTVGGDVQQRSFRVLKPGGTLVAITQPPAPDEAAKYQVNASMLMTEVSSASLETVARMIDAGEIQPCVGRVYPLSEVARAWRDARTSHVEGKIVFSVAG